MNTYDPMDRMVYRHLAAQEDTLTTSANAAADDVHQLPDGYANGSPRTYLSRTRRSIHAA